AQATATQRITADRRHRTSASGNLGTMAWLYIVFPLAVGIACLVVGLLLRDSYSRFAARAIASGVLVIIFTGIVWLAAAEGHGGPGERIPADRRRSGHAGERRCSLATHLLVRIVSRKG